MTNLLPALPARQMLPTKERILQWLSEHGVNPESCEVFDDLSVSVNADVYIIRRKLEYLPLNFREVSGAFDVRENKLWTLAGSPLKIGGHFNCVYNRLTSLQGATEKVPDTFNCGFNSLTDLVGGPTYVGRMYLCNNNELKSLEGLPQKANYLNCEKNQLTSLEHISSQVSSVVVASDNPLTTLKFMPNDIKDELWLHDCSELTSQDILNIKTRFGSNGKIYFSSSLEKDFPGCYQGNEGPRMRQIDIKDFDILRNIVKQKEVLDKEVPLGIGRSSAKLYKI